MAKSKLCMSVKSIQENVNKFTKVIDRRNDLVRVIGKTKEASLWMSFVTCVNYVTLIVIIKQNYSSSLAATAIYFNSSYLMRLVEAKLANTPKVAYSSSTLYFEKLKIN
jgi:hypothetical protein